MFYSTIKMTKIIVFIILLGSLATISLANESAKTLNVPRDLTDLNLNELLEIEVTIVSKKIQKISSAASAVFVVTQEDIRRSGATSIPEVLRIVPGVHVARIDSNKWAVTSRGFNGWFANKLLVLIDGRSVYTPLFAGVFWDRRDTLLEDIERIEVIRGPGATLWGSNAVNGVINIITKNAEDTHGGLVMAGGGTDERAFAGLRYGGKLGANASYRVYTKFFNRDSFVDSTGHDAADGWEVLRGGFRIDWNRSEVDTITFSGDIFNGNRGNKEMHTSLLPPFEQEIDLDVDNAGGHFLSKWTHTFSNTSDIALQFYYDRTELRSETVGEIRDTFDIDFQHRFSLGKHHDIIWGLGYHFSVNDINDKFTVSFDPNSRGDHIVSTFIQDDITLIKDRVHLTLGSKFEHNNYTGIETQPNARFIWTPNDRHSIWGAISRAVRIPSRIENDGRINGQVFPSSLGAASSPILISLFGDHDFDSENLTAYEIGYRLQPTDRFSLDIAGFYNVYDDLRTFEPGSPFIETGPAPSHILIPINTNNKMDGETYGIELAADWKVFNWLHLKGAYTYFEIKLHLDGNSNDFISEAQENQSPQNQFSLRSMINLPWKLEFDTAWRYVDSVSDFNVGSYFNLDIRLGWKPTENLEVSVTGQNLLDSDHQEFGETFFRVPKTEMERGAYFGVRWQL